jgi:hypothetical protein
MDGKIYSDLDRSKALTLINEKKKQGWSNKQILEARKFVTQYNRVPPFEMPAESPLSPQNIARARTKSGKKEVVI